MGDVPFVSPAYQPSKGSVKDVWPRPHVEEASGSVVPYGSGGRGTLEVSQELLSNWFQRLVAAISSPAPDAGTVDSKRDVQAIKGSIIPDVIAESQIPAAGGMAQGLMQTTLEFVILHSGSQRSSDLNLQLRTKSPPQ